MTNTALTPRFEEALTYAARLHAGQTRKKTERPYVGHLLGVASLVLQYGATEDEAIGALLHDAVEDQGGRPRLEEIRAKYGDRVAAIVEGCTDSFEQDAARKPPWRVRKEHYIAHVRTAPHSVKLVSAADKVHNAREILADVRINGGEIWSRFKGGRDGSLWYYRALVGAFGDGWSHPLVDELDRTVTELEALAR